MLLEWFGHRSSQIVIVLMVIAVGSFEVDTSNWTPFAPHGWTAVITGATVVFFAYVGFDAVANSAEESKNPQVTLGHNCGIQNTSLKFG